MADEVIDLATVTALLKQLEPSDLFKVMKSALTEAEKRTKGSTKATASVAKKAGSMPKGVVPKQLFKPRAWVEFTLKDALENGWEAFTIHQEKKDKVTGIVTEEIIEMPASILHDGAHIYDGSVTDKSPNGKQLIHKEAMSLSKQRKATGHATWAEFEASYVEAAPADDETTSTTSSAKKVVVKVTAAEKAAAAEAKKAEKEAEKAAKKAEKEAERAAKKAEKEAEKEAKKAEKEAEKEAKKAAKEAAKKPAAKAPVPAAAIKKAVTAARSSPAGAAGLVKAAPVKATAAAAAPVKAVVKAAPKPAAAATWSCPDDGMVHPWSFKGKQYLRNFGNEVWLKGADGGMGDWQGVYLPTEDRIDDSIPEPEYEDDE
jgi:flagellar biosynthesis GTPase FlhF